MNPVSNQIGFLFQGLFLGFIYAMPVGSLNVYIFYSALQNRFAHTMLTAATIAFVDMTLAVSCFLGLGIVMNRSQGVRVALLSIGILFMLFSGIKLALSKSAMLEIKDNKKEELAHNFPKIALTAVALTWFNPQGLLELSALFSGYRATMNLENGYVFLGGACLGATAWYFTVSTLVFFGKSRITPTVFRGFNLVCGLGLIFFGIRLAMDCAIFPATLGVFPGVQ
jgi:L-lysine exporter family protein LysE/ArgO